MNAIIKNPLALAGLIIIGVISMMAIFAPCIAPYDPDAINVKNILLSPSSMHLMGTDGLGRDVYSRMLFGARISLLVGIVAVGIATIIGIGIALLIGGAVVTETVFNIPGLGRLVVDAILRRDYPIIQGLILVFSFTYIIINMLIDIAYTMLDPRIRY